MHMLIGAVCFIKKIYKIAIELNLKILRGS